MTKKRMHTKRSARTQAIHGVAETGAWQFEHHLVPPLTASTTFRLESLQRGAQGFIDFAHGKGKNHPILIYDRLEEHVLSSCRFEEIDTIASSDVLITSLRPDQFVSLFPGCTPPPTEAVAKLSEYKTMYLNRFVGVEGRNDFPVWIKTSTGETVIDQSCLFETENGERIIDVLSDVALDGASSVFSEDIPTSSIGSNEALLAFNKWRCKQNVDIQVVGKWYYATTGSVTDIVADADRLATLICKRYESFPQRKKENELSWHFVSRSDRCLDFKYQDDDYSVSTRLE